MDLNMPAGGEYVVIPLAYFERLIRQQPAQQSTFELPPPEPTPVVPVSSPLPRGFVPTSPERIARLKQGADDGSNSA